jgi:TrmH family RNA methyltransferase
MQVSAAVLQACSAAQHAQGILAVLPIHWLPLPDELDFIFIPDGVRDPGNLGSMLRTACAAGVQAVLLVEGGVDPWSPKVVRAAMGAHFRLPLLSLPWQEIERLLSKKGMQLYLASAHSGIPYLQADFCTPLGVLIGGEAEGASPAGRELAQQEVHIPMPGGGESLNAAAAAAILLFEVLRQRNAA